MPDRSSLPAGAPGDESLGWAATAQGEAAAAGAEPALLGQDETASILRAPHR
jgi:hypothetical protein